MRSGGDGMGWDVVWCGVAAVWVGCGWVGEGCMQPEDKYNVLAGINPIRVTPERS